MLSVIIPTYSEERRLGRLLKQVQGHDVVVVDGGSSDETLSIAKRYGARVFSGKGRADQQRVEVNSCVLCNGSCYGIVSPRIFLCAYQGSV